MNATSTVQSARGSSTKLRVHTVLSILVAALGVALLAYMITVEDEPGALPLAMMAGGIGWFIVARWRLKPRAAKA
jgi:hypothetical protein